MEAFPQVKRKCSTLNVGDRISWAGVMVNLHKLTMETDLWVCL